MNENYKEFAEGRAKRSPIFKNCLKAFLIGGGICMIGQAFFDLYRYLGASEKTAKTLIPMTVILSVWCAFRVVYIECLVGLIPDIRVVFSAYPVTWLISTVILLSVCFGQF